MVNNPYLAAAEQTPWTEHEAGRLRNMDEMLRMVTERDLEFALHMISDADNMNLVDIGAGTGGVTEELCEEKGINYYALEPNATFLAQRQTERGKMVRARSEGLPFIDESFDITFSRAVTAWNPSPRQAIAEQLRIVRPGGVAIFSEFDWGSCTISPDSQAFEAGMTARAIVLEALTLAGFNPQFGRMLAQTVDEAAEGRIYERQEIRHELPEGDYRQLFLDASENVLTQLRSAGARATMLTKLLEGSMRQVQQVDTFSMHLPAVVTQVVQAGQ